MKANCAGTSRSPLRAIAFAAGLTLLATACSQQREAMPAPRPSQPPPPAPLPPPPPRSTDWRDAPITPGDWHWRMEGTRSVARFAVNALVMSCNRESGTITLMRPGAAAEPVPVTIQTSSVSRTIYGQAEPGPPPAIAVTLPARDSLLDAMAFSRGRFAVETAGLPTLYVPSWTEVSRVIEDCR